MLLIKVLTELLSTGIFTISSINIPEYLPYFLDPSKYLIEYYQILYSMSRYWIMKLTSFFNIKSKNGKNGVSISSHLEKRKL